MTRLLALAASALFLLSQQAGSSPNRPQSSVKEILDHYRQAVGLSAISSISNEISAGTLVRGQSGAVPFTAYATTPGKWRYNQTFAWGDQVNFGFDGSSAWIADTTGFETMDERQKLDWQLILDYRAAAKIEDWFPAMTIVDSDDPGDSNCYVMSAQTQNGREIKLRFDRATGYLVRAGEISFDDYRIADGVNRPFKISLKSTLGNDDFPLELQFKEIRHNLPVDDTVFRQPSCLLRATASPVYSPDNLIELDLPLLEACVGTYRHPTDTAVRLFVTLQGSHLMLASSRGGGEIEIRPKSATDFAIPFLRQEFHFLKDSLGAVQSLVAGADSTRKYRKID